MSRFQRKLHPDFPLHITGRCNNRENFPVPIEHAWGVFSDHLYLINQRFNIRVCAFVLMSNHYHLICRDPELQLSKGMEFFMRETSKEMARRSGRINRIWGAPFYSSIITSPLHYLHAYKYLYRNPVAAAMSENVETYPWSTLQILLGQRRGIFPIEADETLFSNPEGTIKWLNQNYKKEEAMALQQAFRKKLFKISKDSKTRRRLQLESWDSVPLLRTEFTNVRRYQSPIRDNCAHTIVETELFRAHAAARTARPRFVRRQDRNRCE